MSWFRLSWSRYRSYNECSQKYNWTYNVDKESPGRDSKHFAVIGSVVQRVFEYFYEYQVYKRNHLAIDILLEKTEEFFNDFLDEEYVDFNHVTCPYSRGSALSECKEVVQKSYETILRENLIGYKNLSESTIQVPFKRQSLGKVALKGRLDFIIQRGDENDPETLLLDGKATKNPDKVDDDQLLFYSLLFALRYQTLPDKVGFFFFRFGEDDEEPSLRWLDVTPQRLNRIKEDVMNVVKSIRSEEDWEPTPDPSYCRWCPFERVCDKRQSQKQKNRENRMSEKEKAAENFFQGEGGGTFTMSEIGDE